MGKEFKTSWLKVIGISGLIFVIAGLIYVLNINRSQANVASSTYITNINSMKEAGFNYFKGSNLPVKIGETKEISLKEMLDNKLLAEFYDEKGKSCDVNNSFIQVTKTIENEYAMKVVLKCQSKNDYFVTTIVEKETENNTNTNSNTTNNNTATKPKPSNQVKPSSNITYINNCKETACANNVYYTVKFNSNTGSSVENQVVKYKSKATYVVPTLNGYQFDGWYYNGKKFDFNTPITSTITLIARWIKVNDNNNNNQNNNLNRTHVIKFISNGGTTLSPVTVLEYTKVTEPTVSRACYNFVGWYSDSNLMFKYNFNDLVTKDFSLYAKWEENNSCVTLRKVTYIYNNGMNNVTEQIKDGSRATIPKTPSRDGYNFLGWFNGNTIFNFDFPVYQDYVLVAKWEARS